VNLFSGDRLMSGPVLVWIVSHAGDVVMYLVIDDCYLLQAHAPQLLESHLQTQSLV